MAAGVLICWSVSIPIGSIKTIYSYFRKNKQTEFQFQLVRLKLNGVGRFDVCLDVSIPIGSIKTGHDAAAILVLVGFNSNWFD